MPSASLRRVDDGDVVFDGVAEDVDDDGAAGIVAQLGELFCDEALDADVLQADGVDHAGGGLDEAGRRVAGHGLAGEALGDEAADAVEGDDLFKLDAIAEGAAGGDDGRAELDSGEVTRMSGPLLTYSPSP